VSTAATLSTALHLRSRHSPGGRTAYASSTLRLLLLYVLPLYRRSRAARRTVGYGRTTLYDCAATLAPDLTSRARTPLTPTASTCTSTPRIRDCTSSTASLRCSTATSRNADSYVALRRLSAPLLRSLHVTTRESRDSSLDSLNDGATALRPNWLTRRDMRRDGRGAHLYVRLHACGLRTLTHGCS